MIKNRVLLKEEILTKQLCSQRLISAVPLGFKDISIIDIKIE